MALAAEPSFSLTGSASDPAFDFVTPLGAVILEDGSTIIRDGRPLVLIYLNSTGSVSRIAGGPGEGPGEFQYLSAMLAAPGESGVWAWDLRSRRLSHFDRTGEYVTSLVPPPRTGAPPVAILPGPAFVTIAEPEEGTGAEPPRRLYALRDRQWTVVGEIRGPPEPVSPWVTWGSRGGGTSLPEGCVPRLEEVVIGGELFVADAASGVIHAFDEDGSVREIYRASRRQSFTPEMRTALERRFTIPLREAPADVRRDVLQDVRNRLPEQLPAWRRVLADPEGRIWLERSECPLGGPEDVFDVVGIDGRRLGSITIPPLMTVLAVRGDHVLVRRADELMIPHVEMYRLVTAEQAAERTSAGS